MYIEYIVYIHKYFFLTVCKQRPKDHCHQYVQRYCIEVFGCEV